MDPSLYLDRDTWVHRLDPRTKIFLLVGMFALPFVFLNPLYELAVLALVLFFGYLAQSLANLRRIWFILLTILIVTTILWSRSEEHTSELQSRQYLVCRLLLEKKKNIL